MKKLTTALLLLVQYMQPYAQCPVSAQPVSFVYNGVTYTGNNVTCSNSAETTWDSWFASHSSTAFRVDGGVDNGAYNCHSFAWANITTEWINTTGTAPSVAPQIYYLSGKYIKTTDINDAEIAVYGNGADLPGIYPTHSAIHLTNTTSSTNVFAVQYLRQNPQYAGWWISKWDGGPLAIHQLNSCPYYSPGLQITYFKKAGETGTNYIQQVHYNIGDYSVVGPKLVCTSGSQFQISNATTGTFATLPAGYTVTWTGSSHISFSPGASAYPVTVSSSANGSGEWVQAHITFPDGSTGDVAQDMVWSGVPDYIPSISKSQYQPGGPGYITITVPQSNTELYAYPFNNADLFPPNGIDLHGASSYYWTCQYNTYNQNPVVQGVRYTQGGFSNTGQAILTIHASNACGTTTQFQSLSVVPGSYVYSMSPNPASSQLTVNIAKTNSQPIYSVRIVDASGLEHYRSKQTTNTFTIPVSNLKNGNYILEITDGKTISSKPLVIAH